MAKPTTEELDIAQFGRVLHKRPEPVDLPADWGKIDGEDHPDTTIANAATAIERERCAKLIDLIAADWREAGADQKVWASEYLAKQIRELSDDG